jgi:hypothetical protein
MVMGTAGMYAKKEENEDQANRAERRTERTALTRMTLQGSKQHWDLFPADSSRQALQTEKPPAREAYSKRYALLFGSECRRLVLELSSIQELRSVLGWTWPQAFGVAVGLSVIAVVVTRTTSPT